MAKPGRRAGASAPAATRRRRRRGRPTPKWLLKAEDLDQIAKTRCLMMLRVLSGELPVTDAITAAKISRGTYYQLETRALEAMLVALNPLTPVAATSAAATPTRRLVALEAKVKTLEQARRRAERLLSLTRKVIRARPASTRRGRDGSRRSPTREVTRTPRPAPKPSTLTPAGGGGA